MGPLAGLRILDLTSVLMGPCAPQVLGDFGADVIKVEAPDGDVVRQIGPSRHAGMGALFLNVNRSKRSIAPVSPQLTLCFVAEKVLNLPKSY